MKILLDEIWCIVENYSYVFEQLLNQLKVEERCVQLLKVISRSLFLLIIIVGVHFIVLLMSLNSEAVVGMLNVKNVYKFQRNIMNHDLFGMQTLFLNVLR